MFRSLKPEQKEIIGLLQIGTLLEYFDLMLYVHMSFVLNDFFFPRTDSHTAALLTAFAFCSTYVLRPIGGLLFGWIGDTLGRKTTVILSSMMMGFSCIIMANLPTYEQIGISAAYGVTLCRVLQGLACQGEIIGAEIYLIEMFQKPLRYPLVALCSFFASLGGLMALGLSVLLFFLKIDRRLAFWIGAGISSIGFLARTRLRETPEFLKMRHLAKKKVQTSLESKKYTVDKKSLIAYFFISCGYPLCFYLAYMHLGVILKNTHEYSAQDLVNHNFMLSLMQSFSFLVYSLLSYWINPMKLLQFRWIIFFPIMLFYPYWLKIAQSPNELLIFQLFIITFGIMDVPAAGLMIQYFPVLKRFMSASLIYAFSRMAVYVLTSFGLVYLTDIFNEWGVWFLIMLIGLGFEWGIYYFTKAEHLHQGFYMVWHKILNIWKFLGFYRSGH